MLDEFQNLIKSEHRIIVMKNLFNSVEDLIELTSHYFLKDPETKNEAIDYICDLLEMQKTPPKELQ